MVSSNHSFWCSALASRTPHRRMWENNSSRACSKGVGIDSLRGSERFLAMQGHSSLVLGRGGADRRRSNVIGAGTRCKGPAADRGGWYNQTVGGGGGRRRGDGDESHCREGGCMSDDKDQVYGPERAQRLVAMLRALAERIQALDRTGQLFERVPELQKLLGNARSELFHYEVRVTYDTPEIAESRRIVEDDEGPTRTAD